MRLLVTKVIKVLIFIVCSVAVLADVAFVAWATRNPLIVVPVTLAAAYLAYAAARYTVFTMDGKNKIG
jgi:hypothetical protein